MAIPPTSAARTTSPPQPPRIQTTALVFCGAEALTGATGPGMGGVKGGGAGPPGGGPALGCGAPPAGAGVPQLPQNGPCTWAPHFVQNAISPPEGSKVRKPTTVGKSAIARPRVHRRQA